MKAGHLKSWVSIIEILIGLVCIVISVYALIEFQACNPNAEFCKPLAILPVVIILIPGLIALTAGTVSCTVRRIAFWKIQTALVILAGFYYVSLYTYIYHVAN